MLYDKVSCSTDAAARHADFKSVQHLPYFNVNLLPAGKFTNEIGSGQQIYQIRCMESKISSFWHLI